MTSSSAMPRSLTGVRWACTLVFTAVAIWVFWLFWKSSSGSRSDNYVRAVIAVAFASGAVGVARRLIWGLWLGCALLWMLVFAWVAEIMPSTETVGHNPIERLFGGLPPQYIIVGLIVTGTFVILGCVHVLIKNKSHFRRALW